MLFRAYFLAVKFACLAFVLVVIGTVTNALAGFVPEWFGPWVLFPYFVVLIAIGLAAIHFRFRSACPRCGDKGTWTVFGKDLAIDCPSCGLVYGNPWTSFRFQVIPRDDLENESLTPGNAADASSAESSSTAENSEPKVFFECARNGRQWPYLLFGLVFGAVGVGMVAPGTVLALIDHQAQLATVTAWLLFLVLAPALWFVFVFVPAYLLWSFICNTRYQYRIDGAGIHMGSRLYAWKSIRWIGARSAGGAGDSVYFAFGSWWRPDGMFPTYPPLPNEEVCDVLDELEPFLKKHFPDVEISE